MRMESFFSCLFSTGWEFNDVQSGGAKRKSEIFVRRKIVVGSGRQDLDRGVAPTGAAGRR